MDDKGSTTFVRIDARIAKSPRRNGNIGKNRQPFARQRTPCMLSEKRTRSLSPVEREAERLSAGLLRLLLHLRKESPGASVYARARIYVHPDTHTWPPDAAAWKCATIKAHPSRVSRASRCAVRWYADDDTLSGSGRFRTPVSYIVARGEREREPAGFQPPQILPRPLRDAPVCTLVHFSSRPEYTSDRYRLRKEERSVLPTVLLMDAFRLSIATTGWPCPTKYRAHAESYCDVFFFFWRCKKREKKNIQIYNWNCASLCKERSALHLRVKSNRNCLHSYKPCFKFRMKFIASWTRQRYRFKNHLGCMRCPC